MEPGLDLIPPECRYILGTRIDATSYADTVFRVMTWARERQSRYICVTSAHGVMEAHDSPEFQRIVNEADLVTPDGMPLVWGLRRLGIRDARRVYGPDLSPAILSAAADQRMPVGFFGGDPGVLTRLVEIVSERFPGLTVAYAESPPFRPLTVEEDAGYVERITRSGARILFVGLSTPKQERWMAAHRGQVPAVMLGVGAAFDFVAGSKPRAPGWMQRAGLEWFFRLATEPRRLWKRYLKHHPRFAVLFALQMVRHAAGQRPRRRTEAASD